MPLFTIVPLVDTRPLIQFVSDEDEDVFHIMRRIECDQADIYRGMDYLLTAQRYSTDVWSVSRRADARALPCDTFGLRVFEGALP